MMRRLVVLLMPALLLTTVAHSASDDEETDGESSRRIIGSSVVTSVSVVLNGQKPEFTDAIGKPVPRPLVPPQVASPINLLNPDKYEFYTFDESGELVKRLMTMEEIQSIVAGGDGEGSMLMSQSTNSSSENDTKVDEIVESVQNVLNKEMEAKRNSTNATHPIFDTPDVSASWSLILPAIFGNTGNHEIITHKPPGIAMTPESELLEATTKSPAKITTFTNTPSSLKNTETTPSSSSKAPDVTVVTTEKTLPVTTEKTLPVTTVKSSPAKITESPATKKTTPVPNDEMKNIPLYHRPSTEKVTETSKETVTMVKVTSSVETTAKTPTTTKKPTTTPPMRVRVTANPSRTPPTRIFITRRPTESTTINKIVEISSVVNKVSAKTPTTSASSTTQRVITTKPPVPTVGATKKPPLTTISLATNSPTTPRTTTSVRTTPTVKTSTTTEKEIEVEETTNKIEMTVTASTMISSSPPQVQELSNNTEKTSSAEMESDESTTVEENSINQIIQSLSSNPNDEVETQSTLSWHESMSDGVEGTTVKHPEDKHDDDDDDDDDDDGDEMDEKMPTTVNVISVTEPLKNDDEPTEKTQPHTADHVGKPNKIFANNQLYVDESEPQVSDIPTTPEPDDATTTDLYTELETVEATTIQAQQVDITPLPQKSGIVDLIDRFIAANTNSVQITLAPQETEPMISKVEQMVQSALRRNVTMTDFMDHAATMASILQGDEADDLTTDRLDINLEESLSNLLFQVTDDRPHSVPLVEDPNIESKQPNVDTENAIAEEEQVTTTIINDAEDDPVPTTTETNEPSVTTDLPTDEATTDNSDLPQTIPLDEFDPDKKFHELESLAQVTEPTVQEKNNSWVETSIVKETSRISLKQDKPQTTRAPVTEVITEISMIESGPEIIREKGSLDKNDLLEGEILPEKEISGTKIVFPGKDKFQFVQKNKLQEKRNPPILHTEELKQADKILFSEQNNIPEKIQQIPERVKFPQGYKRPEGFKHPPGFQRPEEIQLPERIKISEELETSDSTESSETESTNTLVESTEAPAFDRTNLPEDNNNLSIENQLGENPEFYQTELPRTTELPEKTEDFPKTTDYTQQDYPETTEYFESTEASEQNSEQDVFQTTRPDEKTTLEHDDYTEFSNVIEDASDSGPLSSDILSIIGTVGDMLLDDRVQTTVESLTAETIDETTDATSREPESTISWNERTKIPTTVISESMTTEKDEPMSDEAIPEEFTTQVPSTLAEIVETIWTLDSNTRRPTTKFNPLNLRKNDEEESIGAETRDPLANTVATDDLSEEIITQKTTQRSSPKTTQYKVITVGVTRRDDGTPINFPTPLGFHTRVTEVIVPETTAGIIHETTTEISHDDLTNTEDDTVSTTSDESEDIYTRLGETTEKSPEPTTLLDAAKTPEENSIPGEKDEEIPTTVKLPSQKHPISIFHVNTPKPASISASLKNNPRKPVPVNLKPAPKEALGLEQSTQNLDQDLIDFVNLCNELAFTYWKAMTAEGISTSRTVVVAPFAITSMLAMIFLGARGSTSGEMNEILRLDDMVTFNPHAVFRNVTDSIENLRESGVFTSAVVRELFSDRSKGKLLSFYKDKVQQFYSGHVEEVNYTVINDVIRRRTNLLMKRHTWGKVMEFLKTNTITMRPPLATVSANIFKTDCSKASSFERDGEMFFQISPIVRQRRLVPLPAAVFRSGFMAGYDPELDATAVAFGNSNNIVSTVLVMPGQQGHLQSGDSLDRLEIALLQNGITKNAWRRLLTTLMERPGLELQIPKFTHRSFINATSGLQRMGLNDLFDAEKSDLRGLTASASKDMFFSDMVQINAFATCGEDKNPDQHHVEVYPSPPIQKGFYLGEFTRGLVDELPEHVRMKLLMTQEHQRALFDPFYETKYLELPLSLRPRQARIPEAPRLRFDRPFLFFVRHNPTGMILYMGRFSPRLHP
ncbi:hypothetical protein DMENIID0001_099210 [Sergentomyia squamirostris]